MSSVRNRLVAICLLALWLVATQHCGLESLGLFAAHGDEAVQAAGCCAGSEHCAKDDCRTIEEGEYRGDVAGVKVTAPLLVPVSVFTDLREALPQPERDPPPNADEFTERPLDWVPSWQFVRRAAAPAHAPDLLSV